MRSILEGYCKRRKNFIDSLYHLNGEKLGKNCWLKDGFFYQLLEIQGMTPEEIFEVILHIL